MINYFKRAFKWLMKMVKISNFFCQVSSLECKLEDALSRCEALKEEVKDKTLREELEAIGYRIDYARYRMLSIRNRGKDIIAYEDVRGL